MPFIPFYTNFSGLSEEHLYLLLILLQPGRSKLAVMYLQIVQNQEHYLL